MLFRSFPGSAAISQDGKSACTSAFRAYVGITYAQSVYTWTNIIPDAVTWPAGDRALHCIAYYATARQPAGVTGPIAPASTAGTTIVPWLWLANCRSALSMRPSYTSGEFELMLPSTTGWVSR